MTSNINPARWLSINSNQADYPKYILDEIKITIP